MKKSLFAVLIILLIFLLHLASAQYSYTDRSLYLADNVTTDLWMFAARFNGSMLFSHLVTFPTETNADNTFLYGFNATSMKYKTITQSVLNVNRSNYWDDKDVPSDIGTSELTNDADFSDDSFSDEFIIKDTSTGGAYGETNASIGSGDFNVTGTVYVGIGSLAIDDTDFTAKNNYTIKATNNAYYFTFEDALSASSEFSFFEEIKPDGNTCAVGDIILKGANDAWRCQDNSTVGLNKTTLDTLYPSLSNQSNQDGRITDNEASIVILDTNTSANIIRLDSVEGEVDTLNDNVTRNIDYIVILNDNTSANIIRLDAVESDVSDLEYRECGYSSTIVNVSGNDVTTRGDVLVVNDPDSLYVWYPAISYTIVNESCDVLTCDMPAANITVTNNQHTVYYVDHTCSVQSATSTNFRDADISRGNVQWFMTTVAHNAHVDTSKGATLGFNRAYQSARNDFFYNNVKVADGLDLTLKSGTLEVSYATGHYQYIETVVATTVQNISDDGFEFVYHTSGDWVDSDITRFNVTHCDNGTDLVACDNTNRYRRIPVGVTGFDDGTSDNTEGHQFAAQETEYFTTLSGCENIEASPITNTYPSWYDDGIVITHYVCCQASTTDLVSCGVIDVRKGGGAGGAGIDTSVFLTKDGQTALTAAWQGGLFNATFNGINVTEVNTVEMKATGAITGSSINTGPGVTEVYPVIDKANLTNAGTLAFDWVDGEVADTLTIDGSSSVTWTGLTSYPVNCSEGDFVYAVGDTLLCGTPAGGGDVLSVGDCADGACYDGSADGGTYTRLYDGDTHYLELNPSDLTADRIIAFRDAAGTVLLSGDTLTGDVTATFDTDGGTATAIASGVVGADEIADAYIDQTLTQASAVTFANTHVTENLTVDIDMNVSGDVYVTDDVFADSFNAGTTGSDTLANQTGIFPQVDDYNIDANLLLGEGDMLQIKQVTDTHGSQDSRLYMIPSLDQLGSALVLNISTNGSRHYLNVHSDGDGSGVDGVRLNLYNDDIAEDDPMMIFGWYAARNGSYYRTYGRDALVNTDTNEYAEFTYFDQEGKGDNPLHGIRLRGKYPITLDSWYNGHEMIIPAVTNDALLGSASYAWQAVYSYIFVDVNATSEDKVSDMLKRHPGKTAKDIYRQVKATGKTETDDVVDLMYPVMFYQCGDGNLSSNKAGCEGHSAIIPHRIRVEEYIDEYGEHQTKDIYEYRNKTYSDPMRDISGFQTFMDMATREIDDENLEMKEDNEKLLDLLKNKNVISQEDINNAGFKRLKK